MPVNLKAGDRLGDYTVARDEFAQGGQARGYYLEGGRFLKMFMEPTALDPEAPAFAARQRALGERLRRIPLFVLQDLDFFEDDGTFYKVSELMTGVTLDQRLRSGADWAPEDRLRTARMLAFTLSQVHAQGIIHLDLKPANCVLDEKRLPSGAVRELVRLLDFDGGYVEGEPRPEMIMGTPGFMSPEHVSEAEVGPWSDVFSLGLLLQYVLGVRSPWVPPQAHLVLERCLRLEPAERPTALEVYEALQAPLAAPGALVWLGGPWKARVDGRLSRDSVRGFEGYQCVEADQATLTVEGPNWVLTPREGTANPTCLNGQALTEPVVLLPGDVLEVGLFRVQVGVE